MQEALPEEFVTSNFIAHSTTGLDGRISITRVVLALACTFASRTRSFDKAAMTLTADFACNRHGVYVRSHIALAGQSVGYNGRQSRYVTLIQCACRLIILCKCHLCGTDTCTLTGY